MWRLAKRIVKGDWEKHKRDKDLEPYLHVKQELSVAEGLIFRERRIILPPALQRKVVKLGHSLGHLGKTKTKQMLREKYWFPLMNSMIDTAIDQCYECQVATKRDREEPIKVTSIPTRPWDTISIDHGGPYPDGHYNLVLIDKRTRYAVVENVPSTDFQTNKERLKHIFATYGTPKRIESNNGPPFNSKDFNEFAKQEGFQHHRVMAFHPRGNGEVERFMQTLNKVEQIASFQGKSRLERRNAIQDMLIAYRSTPHPATGVAPYDALKGAPVRTKLDYIEPEPQRNEKDDIIDRRDAVYKQKMKQQREGSSRPSDPRKKDSAQCTTCTTCTTRYSGKCREATGATQCRDNTRTRNRTSTRGTVQPTGEQTSSDKTQKGKASAFISEGLYVSLTVDLVSLLD